MAKRRDDDEEISVVTTDETAEVWVEETPVISEKVPEKSGIFVYLGPTIRGFISNGRIYAGTKTAILKDLESLISKYPQIERLVIRDCDIALAREKLSSGEGAISVAFKALEDKLREG